MLTHLRSHEPALCRQWFEEIEPLGVAGGVLRLRAHSLVHRDYLQRRSWATDLGVLGATALAVLRLRPTPLPEIEE